MINRDPVEFVVSARDGFTKDLFQTACEQPGRRVRAGLEGAYGCVPEVCAYDSVVLFAGGSGATFAFALAGEWARRFDGESQKRLEVVWSVRTAGELKFSKSSGNFVACQLRDADRETFPNRPPSRFQTRTLRPRIPSESNSTRTHDTRKTKPRRNPLTTTFTTRDRKTHPDPPTDYRRRKAPNNQIREDSNHHHHNHHNRTPLVHHPRPAQRPHHSRTSRRRLHARGESASRGLRTGGFGGGCEEGRAGLHERGRAGRGVAFGGVWMVGFFGLAMEKGKGGWCTWGERGIID